MKLLLAFISSFKALHSLFHPLYPILSQVLKAPLQLNIVTYHAIICQYFINVPKAMSESLLIQQIV